jgi:hypothetical protein
VTSKPITLAPATVDPRILIYYFVKLSRAAVV